MDKYIFGWLVGYCFFPFYSISFPLVSLTHILLCPCFNLFSLAVCSLFRYSSYALLFSILIIHLQRLLQPLSSYFLFFSLRCFFFYLPSCSSSLSPLSSLFIALALVLACTCLFLLMVHFSLLFHSRQRKMTSDAHLFLCVLGSDNDICLPFSGWDETLLNRCAQLKRASALLSSPAVALEEVQ